MKKYLTIFSFFSYVVCVTSCTNIMSDRKNEPVKNIDTLEVISSETFKEAFNFIILSDWGWNGFEQQQQVADQMEKTADSIDAEFIASCGDNFQVNGVASASDPLWNSNFEEIYNANSLQIDWYPVLGNHDYKGNTQAQIDYSKISRRWRMTDHYYTFTRDINDSVSARFIFLDTPRLIEEYRNNPEEYPDASKNDKFKEINWIREVLENTDEEWILVFGHHPVYSASGKHGNTEEMIEYIKPLFEEFDVQFYFSGHDHDLQHLRDKKSNVDYIVTGTGGKIRPSSSNDMSVFSKSEAGFSVVSLKDDSLKICFVGTKGNIIYNYSRTYR